MRTYMDKAFYKAAMWTGIVFVALCYMQHNTPTGPPVQRPLAVGSPFAMFANHDCEYTASELPTRAILRTDSGDWFFANREKTARAFAEAVDGVSGNEKFHVFGWCK